MRTTCRTLFTVCLAIRSVLAAESGPVGLVPAPSESQWGESIGLRGPGSIVVSAKAGPAETLAAQLFCRNIERRFGEKWVIQPASDALPATSLCIILGLREGFPLLDRVCSEQHLSIPDHPEAYALKVWRDGERTTALVAGVTGRSIFYGQDTLLQLFGKKAEAMTVQAATIRDWPTIPLRGRPHPHYQYFLKPGNFDCIMSSRINFIDVRDGIYAFEPGAKLNRDEIHTVIKAARDRDLRVYAVVNCGVPAREQEAVIATFKEFLDLGADALWASFDDKGSGEAPREMVNRILALGREHNIAGDAIAVTPPKGDYQVIKTKFNREIVGIPGIEQAVWYWTSVPCAQDKADGESIGLRAKPSWWHNWPRLAHPSLNPGPRSYVPVLDMADGWNHPSEKELRQAGDYVHAVLPWDGWQAQQQYLVPVIGWWSWRPEQYDAKAIRRRIYDTVFGPEQVESAFAFDDRLNAIQNRFQYWSTQTDYAPNCPPRLKSPDDRPKTVAELQVLQSKLAGLKQSAMKASLLDRTLLNDEYIETMRMEVEAGLAMAQAPYPEYWWQKHQDQLLDAIYDKDSARAEQLIAGVRDRVRNDIAKVEQSLGTAADRDYLAWWQKRADATVVDWQKLLGKRQAELLKRIEEYSRTVAPAEQMLAGLSDPPVQLGTGAWVKHNQVLATVSPEPRETFWGDWIGGIYEHAGTRVAAFALEKHLRVNAGTYSELPITIPVSGRRDRLALLVYLADANKESFGLGYAKWRWSGYRAIRLFWGEKELWKADLGIPRLTGEWFVVELPALPSDVNSLSLRLRVEDYYNAKNNLEIVYVGPIRLLELDRD